MMREFAEFRVSEDYAVEHLPEGIGVRLGDAVRKVVVATDDPLYCEIGQLYRSFRQQNKFFFLGWRYLRHYSSRELFEAKLLHVWPQKTFEPAGEECGTIYDDTMACDYVIARTPETEIGGYRITPSVDTCGVGARQTTPLFLNGRRIPRNVDIARTIADEVIVSARLVELFRKHELSGAEFDAVRLSNRRGALSGDHYQLKVMGQRAELDSATRAGDGPFDEEGYGRCPKSHLIGLNLLSEVTVKGTTIPKAEVMATRQMVGVRRGLLRPSPLILLSPKAWRVVNEAGLKGLGVEVAHVV